MNEKLDLQNKESESKGFKRPSKDLYLPFLILGAILFVLGLIVGQNFVLPFGVNPERKITITGEKTPANIKVNFSPFWEAWDSVTKNYLEPGKVDPQKLLYGAISGMVGAVGDPYTVFLDPNENKDFNSELEGTYQGVGIQLGFRDSKLVIIAPLDGTPAKNAGVRPGDVILGIDDKDTSNLTLPEAVKLIRGEPGTKVKLLLKREGRAEPLEVNLERSTIKVPSVVFENKDSGIALIKLSRFGESTKSEWDKAVNDIINGGFKKMILDVRNNPGGQLDVAEYIVSEFVVNGTVVVQQETSGGQKISKKSEREGRLQNVDTIVLINKGSASASEIVAGALRDLKRFKLIGETSFGKGTVQAVNELPDGSALHITTTKWLTPNDTWVNGSGLKPDIEVKFTEEDFKTNKDPQLQKALELIK